MCQDSVFDYTLDCLLSLQNDLVFFWVDGVIFQFITVHPHPSAAL